MENEKETVVGSEIRSIERNISSAIRKADADIRKEIPMLKHQDAIGLSIFCFSLIGIAASWLLYFDNAFPVFKAPIAIISIAIFTSFLHELEHDLIHNLYFKSNSLIQDAMFFIIWISKLHGNPWFRKDLHLKHHIISGQVDDAEERLIGLGLPFGLERLAVTIHPAGGMIVTDRIARDAKFLDVQKMNLTSAPTFTVLLSLTKIAMLIISLHYALGIDLSHLIPNHVIQLIWDLNVLICFPNLMRQACLQLMSNCSHYYADIPEKSVFFQNQILDHWLALPFQIFCFNFGATHIVHHYVPGQPFYIRELCYHRVKSFMISQGVRHNDFGIVGRSNRFHKKSDTEDKASTSLTIWFGIFTLLGLPLYALFDAMVTYYLTKRIIAKYVVGIKKVA